MPQEIEENRIRTINKNDTEFPYLLKEVEKGPNELHIIGTLPTATDIKYLCVVGSRSYTPYGKQACEYLIRSLAGYNICIVSGLAVGLDACAHRAALNTGLKTIAFPGSGLNKNVLYPRSNHQLADDIIKSGGALVSEFDHDQGALPWAFPARNRLMAGMSHATLVIEAGEKSGTLITSRLALDYGRDVAIVPGSIFSPYSVGALSLLRDGATPITCRDDILDLLEIPRDSELIETTPRVTNDLQLPDALSHIEVKILQTLVEPQPFSKIQEITSLPLDKLLSALSELEVKGCIEHLFPDTYKRI